MPLKDGALNEILPFAPEGLEAAGDIMPLAEYKTLTTRLRGFVAGIARRSIFNRAHRQAAHMAAGVAQYIANRYTPGVVDDADLDKVEEGLRQAVRAESTQLGLVGLTISAQGDLVTVWFESGDSPNLADYQLLWLVPEGTLFALNDNQELILTLP